MSRVILADTGPLYALVDPSDRNHQRAQQELQAIERQKRSLMVLSSTLLETYRLVLYRLGTQTALQFAEEIQKGAELYNPQVLDYQQALERLKQYPDQKISLCDAVVAVVAERLGYPVWTYDHHFFVMTIQVWQL
ncbi:MAG: PIN domain-containing protein [Spirulina sp. SIO3F2]|nr:PIN domain-containing protein [Spirulina sp. SIO3F2]